MDNCAQLGPLDVQLGRPDELGEVISGLTPVHALDFLQEHTFKLFEHSFLSLIRKSGYQITTKTASEIASKLTVGVFEPVYSQLDPLKLGEYHRNMKVAVEYGQRLMEHGNLISKEALEKLNSAYPSHGFVIDQEEVKTLFKNVRCPSEHEKKMADKLKEKIYSDLFYQDGTGRFVARIHYINPDTKIESKEEVIDKTEKNTNEKEARNNNLSREQKHENTEPKGNGDNISNTG